MQKQTITQSEYWQLVGLLTVAKQYVSIMDSITNAALQITQERDSGGELDTTGHTADGVFCGYSVETLLSRLNIKVEGAETDSAKEYLKV